MLEVIGLIYIAVGVMKYADGAEAEEAGLWPLFAIKKLLKKDNP